MQSFSISYSIQSDGGGTFSVFTTKLHVTEQSGSKVHPNRFIITELSKTDSKGLKKKHGVKLHEVISDAEILPQWFTEGWLLVLNDLMEEGENDKQVGWIYSPNIRVIKIAPWCIWVKICFNPANTLEMYISS